MLTRPQIRHALQEADSLLQDLGIDQEAPVDVFDIVDQLGLWLVFNPLQNLLGATVPQGSGGIMLTTQRGVAVQRYTAAHEIGHWVLDYDQASFDTEDDIYRPEAEREHLAQIFASQLLMPPPLLFAACTRYGIKDSPSATPQRVYLLARDIGSSYQAAVRQLTNLEMIGATRRDELLRIQPAAIKTELCLGHRPTGAVDVWPVGLDSVGSTVSVTEGDEVMVLLPENRTTGYRWLTNDDLAHRSMRTRSEPPALDPAAPAVPVQPDWRPSPRRREPTRGRDDALARIPGNGGAVRILREPQPQLLPASVTDDPAETTPSLKLVDDRYQAAGNPVAASDRRTTRRALAHGETPDGTPQLAVGGTGTRLLALRSAGEGRQSFQVVYSSAYDPDAPAIETYAVDVDIKASPAVLKRREYLDVDLDAGHDEHGGDRV